MVSYLNEKWRVSPKKIGRSRKIQVRQFEPEEISIEYELQVDNPAFMSEAIQEATKLAIAYLDEEEKKLRRKSSLAEEIKDETKDIIYDLVISDEGRKFGIFKIKPSEDPQFLNYLHLWFEKDQNDLYIGYLRKDTGEFKFKDKNIDLITKLGIKEGFHFKIIRK